MNRQIKNTAITAAKKAGRILLSEYKKFDRASVKLKSHHEILTNADLKSEKAIIDEIKKKFPEHRILSEEKGKIKGKSDYLWIIDPLDGTTNFSIHNPIWCVSIALARGDEIILGVIYAPFLGEFFIAEKGGRAFLYNSSVRHGRRIKVSKNIKPTVHTFCHGGESKYIKKALSYYNKQKLKGFDCRQLGSAALELAYVAVGRVESIMIPGIKSWDVAAGVLLVREAGGRVTDFSGKKWNLKSKDMLATNGKAHKKILNMINNKYKIR